LIWFFIRGLARTKARNESQRSHETDVSKGQPVAAVSPTTGVVVTDFAAFLPAKVAIGFDAYTVSALQ